ncbi:MAG: 16S rRNA (adenine(1518)-N(6)/adenine(1519)-N(6))-dimethyltransferase RsmA [Thermoplasmata archaeon]|jgi:16S rRNA (adenine1518-N6/adenine1519-N6)-dimethyltransferase
MISEKIRMKRNGQVLLKDKNLVKIIVSYAQINENEEVLEIGPGMGILTSELLSSGAKVYAIEKSKEFYEYLRTYFFSEINDGKLKLILGDALKEEFSRFDKIVSNIPYNISSPITFKLLKHQFKLGIIMYQKEFAQRLVAKPGSNNYSRLTVNVYYYADVSILRYVPRTVFYPIPKVDSAIVKIVPNKKFSVKDEKLFFEITEKLFSQRRKKIKNIIGNVPYSENRVEELTPEQIGEIADYVYEKVN